MRKHPAALTAAAAALLVFFAVTFAYPLSRMLAQITPEVAAAVFSSTVFRRAVGSSCLSGGLTVLFALPLAMLMALLTESTRVRCRALWRGIFVLPMLLPSVSQGTGLVLLLGTNGLLTRGLCLPGSIYGLQGIVLGQVLYTAPIAYLLLANLLRYRSRSPVCRRSFAGAASRCRFCARSCSLRRFLSSPSPSRTTASRSPSAARSRRSPPSCTAASSASSTSAAAASSGFCC